MVALLVRLRQLSVIVMVFLVMAPPLPSKVFASNDPLEHRYDKISDSTASVVAIHEIGFEISETAVPIGSISMEFCQNSAVIGDPCIAPSGFSAAGAVLALQTGQTGFSIGSASTVNRIVLTRPPAVPSFGVARYTFQGIINPDISQTYYVRLQTFTSTDGTGLDIESGGVTFYIIGAVNVNAEVPPYLKFCAAVSFTVFDCNSGTNFLIDFGEFTRTLPNAATSEMIAATNAPGGYAITVTGTTLTSGTNIIPAIMPAAGSAVGTSQFGFNLRANTNPVVGTEHQGLGIATASPGYDIPNLFQFQPGDIVATSTGATDNSKFTVSYVVNINSSQAPGIYATTMTYICLANF